MQGMRSDKGFLYLYAIYLYTITVLRGQNYPIQVAEHGDSFVLYVVCDLCC